MKSKLPAFAFVLLSLMLILPLSAGAYTVVLDRFDVDPYIIDPEPPVGGSGFTGVFYPPNAQPAGWVWGYFGYGDTTGQPGDASDDPVIGFRDTIVNTDGSPSWRVQILQNANLSPYTATNACFNNEGPILMTVLGDPGMTTPVSDPRTLDAIIAELGHPPIDWTLPVTFLVDVWGDCDSQFEGWTQGINLFNYDGTVLNVGHYTCGQNPGGWNTASVEVVGPDSDGKMALGVFTSLSWNTANCAGPAQLGNPAATMRFDNFRIEYTPFIPVPTFSQWGLIVIALALLLSGLYFIRRRMRAA